MTISPPNSRRIPTILGIVLVIGLVAAVAFTTQAAQKITRIFSQAETADNPVSAGFANLTDTSVTTFWTTERETSGAVFYGRSRNLGEGVAVDERDFSSASGKYFTHMVRLSGLKPSTKYYFKIGVGTATFGDPAKSGEPFEVTTGPALTHATIVEPIFGKILDASGTVAPGVIVLWQTTDATKIAAMSKNDGTFVLPIGEGRSANLQSYSNAGTGASETISLDAGGDRGKASITCKIGLDRPLPTIKLGQTLDCEKKPEAPPSGGFKVSQTQTIASSSAGQSLINVTNGQMFNNSLPTISGKAGPNQVVQIVIHSETPYSGTVQAGPDGSWSWTPPSSLSPGQHTVTITIINPNGTTITETRTFTVESGSPILPITSGTPSASLTHMSCVGNTCSTVAGAGSNSCVTDTDCAPMLPAPIATPPAVPVPTPPATGNTENTLVMLTLGLILATLGMGVLAKNNGQ